MKKQDYMCINCGHKFTTYFEKPYRCPKCNLTAKEIDEKYNISLIQKG